MAVPKRKKSRARTRHRKSNWLRTRPPTVGRCPQCGEVVRPHTVCKTCGTYGGRQVIEPSV